MMKLVEELVARAEAADQRAGVLAERQMASMQRVEAYNRLEQTFEQMAADGYLDEGELQQLLASFRQQGLDTKTIEGLIKDLNQGDSASRTEASSELRGKIANQLQDAKYQARDLGPGFHLEVQELVNRHQHDYDLAGRVLKAEDEMYKTAIKNIVG